jgi:hypothetical protein
LQSESGQLVPFICWCITEASMFTYQGAFYACAVQASADVPPQIFKAVVALAVYVLTAACLLLPIQQYVMC